MNLQCQGEILLYTESLSGLFRISGWVGQKKPFHQLAERKK
jgi:hypothetical protein